MGAQLPAGGRRVTTSHHAPTTKLSVPQLQAWLLQQAHDVGFDDAAVVRVDDGLAPRSNALRALVDDGLQDALPYMTTSVDDRADIRRRVPGAKSVLVVVQNYFTKARPPAPSPHHMRVSRYAWGKDYHQVMKKKLVKLRKRLMAYAERFADDLFDDDERPIVSAFNDASPVLERGWAEAGGLGSFGKSTMFIHRRFGTYTFLGGLVTNIDVGGVAVVDGGDVCGSCTACLDACPTGAIVQPFEVDAARCISTWTVERPLEDAPTDVFVGHDWAMGCDVCQEVCPHNKFAQPTSEARFAPLPGHVWLDDDVPGDLAGTPLARPGVDGLARNVERARQASTAGTRLVAWASLTADDVHALATVASTWATARWPALEDEQLKHALRKALDSAPDSSDDAVVQHLAAVVDAHAVALRLRRGRHAQPLTLQRRRQWVQALLQTQT